MADLPNKVEQHGCIVCGKLYALLVEYAPDGRLVDCTVTSPGGQRVPDEHRPLVACNSHTQVEIDNALARHYPGQVFEDPADE